MQTAGVYIATGGRVAGGRWRGSRPGCHSGGGLAERLAAIDCAAPSGSCSMQVSTGTRRGRDWRGEPHADDYDDLCAPPWVWYVRRYARAGGYGLPDAELSWSRGRQVRWTLCGSASCTRRRYPYGGGSVGNNHCVRFSSNVPLSTKHWYIRTFEEPFLSEMLKRISMYRFNATGLDGVWKSLTGQVFRSSLGMSIQDWAALLWTVPQRSSTKERASTNAPHHPKTHD